MSHLEHLGLVLVGNNFKQPFLPIWVVIKEYHYSVVFSNEMNDVLDDQLEKRNVDLIYYDGFNHPDDFIVLRLSKPHKGQKQTFANGIVPSMNQVLMTKWGEDLFVEWLGVEPIL